MFLCAFEILLIVLLATIPAICALFQSLSVIPRRQKNITKVVEAALAKSPEPVCEPDETGKLVPTLRESDRIAPGHYLAARGGTQRINEDFRALYGGSFRVSAAIVTILYLSAFWLGLSLIAPDSSGCWFPGKNLIALLHGMDKMEFNAYDRLRHMLLAVLGAYIFNVGVMVRRAFLNDITEHVFWSAINRLLLAASIGLVVFMGHHAFESYVYFGIAFFPRVFISSIKRRISAMAEKFSKSQSQDKTEELSLDLVQGIDLWKEQRLEEEGIESIQNLATADVLTLAVKTHYPLRTLIDWIDQAILINRLPGKLCAIRNAGLPISAIEFAWMAPENSKSDAMAGIVASTAGFQPMVAATLMNSLYEDAYVNALWSLWQTDPEHRDAAAMGTQNDEIRSTMEHVDAPNATGKTPSAA